MEGGIRRWWWADLQRKIPIAGGKVTEQEVDLKNIGRVRDVADGPDVYLYELPNGPNRVIRLEPAE